MVEILGFVKGVPWFLPGLALSIILGYFVRRRVARTLGSSESLAWVAVVSFGLVLSATLTPLYGRPFDGGIQSSGCDFSRMGLASLSEVLDFDDPTLNILLFIPLGAVLAFVSGSRRKVRLLVAALFLPILIETTQLLVTPLERACQSGDVFDNGTGLLIGFALGSVLAVICGVALALVAPKPDPRSSLPSDGPPGAP